MVDYSFEILTNCAMSRISKAIICLIFICPFIEGFRYSDTNLVECKAFSTNNSIESKVTTKKGLNGQNYITISLTNKGKAIDKIDSIEVLIKQSSKNNEQTQIMVGGTCMGRTPIKQSDASDTRSETATFLLTKHNQNNYTLVGILTWNTFMPYIHYNSQKDIVIKAFGEKKPIKPGETIYFERIVETQNDSWQDLMFNYGEEIAKEHQIKPKKSLELKGWSTWDYYGRVYDTKDVIKNIDQLSAHGISANIIQIDGGWWTERGDYLSVRKNLVGGMKAIADYAKSKGYRAGIHLDGFRADKASELFKNHPDWFLKDQDGETICQAIDRKDTYMQYIYFDYSNPAVCAYMKNILKTIRTQWGFSYFKIDFMRYGLLETILSEHGKDRLQGSKKVTAVNSFNNNITSVERTRAGLKAMREGIGDGFFLACSSIFGPTIGIVDGIRTGGDISPSFDYYQTRCLQNAGNFYMNHVIVQTDADYLVVRNKDDEESNRAWGTDKFGGNTTLNEAKMWADYVALYGGIKINSDNLTTLRNERKNLIKNAFSLKTATRFLPIDFWSHAKNNKDAYNIMLAENEDGVYLSLFNWNEEDKQFIIEGLENTEISEAYTKEKIITRNGKLTIETKGHSSKIFKIKGKSFDYLRKKINND